MKAQIILLALALAGMVPASVRAQIDAPVAPVLAGRVGRASSLDFLFTAIPKSRAGTLDLRAQYIFYCGNGNPTLPGHLTAFQIVNGTLTPLGTSVGSYANLGSTPIVSSNGNDPSTAIVWAVDRGYSEDSDIDPTQTPKLQLRAYDLPSLVKGTGSVAEKLNLQLGSWIPAGRAFIEPLVINGKVYVAFTHADGTAAIGVCF